MPKCEEKERLLEFIRYLKMSQREFERSIGAPNGTIKGIRRGLSRDRTAAVRKIYPQLNIEWLQFGKGDMIINVENKGNVANIGTNQGTVNQGTPASMPVDVPATSDEKNLYKKVIDLLEAKVKQLEDEKTSFLQRHGCSSYDQIDDKLRNIIDDGGIEYNK